MWRMVPIGSSRELKSVLTKPFPASRRNSTRLVFLHQHKFERDGALRPRQISRHVRRLLHLEITDGSPRKLTNVTTLSATNPTTDGSALTLLKCFLPTVSANSHTDTLGEYKALLPNQHQCTLAHSPSAISRNLSIFSKQPSRNYMDRLSLIERGRRLEVCLYRA